MDRIFGKVCIAGAGVMGTSLGLALKERGIAERVVGWDRVPERMDAALVLGAFDGLSAFPQDELGEADLLIAAVPTSEVPDVARRYGPLLTREGAMFMDLSSVKQAIFGECVVHLSSSARYVSSNPFILLQKADPGAFEGALVALCPELAAGEAASEEKVGAAFAMWTRLGAEVRLMPYEEHDLVRACYVDLPRLLATSQVTATSELAEVFGALFGVGEGGFGRQSAALFDEGVTGEEIAADIAENRAAVLAALPRAISILEDMRTWLERREQERVVDLVKEARQVRDAFVRGSEASVRPNEAVSGESANHKKD